LFVFFNLNTNLSFLSIILGERFEVLSKNVSFSRVFPLSLGEGALRNLSVVNIDRRGGGLNLFTLSFRDEGTHQVNGEARDDIGVTNSLNGEVVALQGGVLGLELSGGFLSLVKEGRVVELLRVDEDLSDGLLLLSVDEDVVDFLDGGDDFEHTVGLHPVEGEGGSRAKTLEFVDLLEIDGTLPEDGELLGGLRDGLEVLLDGFEVVAGFSGFVEELSEEGGIRGDDVDGELAAFEVGLVDLLDFSRGSVEAAGNSDGSEGERRN